MQATIAEALEGVGYRGSGAVLEEMRLREAVVDTEAVEATVAFEKASVTFWVYQTVDNIVMWNKDFGLIMLTGYRNAIPISYERPLN